VIYIYIYIKKKGEIKLKQLNEENKIAFKGLGLLRASSSSSAFQTFHQILVKFLKLPLASSSLSFHQITTCQNPSPNLTPKISTLFYSLIFFSFSRLSSPSSRKISVTFLSKISVTFLCIKPSAKGSKPLIFQALGQLVQATRWAFDGRGRDRARRRCQQRNW